MQQLMGELCLNSVSTGNASQEMARIMAQVAHDIKSPLAVLNYLKQNLATIQENDRRLFDLCIDNIRDISKKVLSNNYVLGLRAAPQVVEQGGAYPAREQLIWPLLEMCVEAKKIEVSSAGQTTECQFILKEPAQEVRQIFSKFDPSEFCAVLSNLMNNALEAGATFVEISVDKKNNSYVQLSVSDNGAGISPEVLEKVRTQYSTKTTGYGLGLSSAIRVVESVKGSVEISSKQEQGTRIDISLPVAKAPKWFLGNLARGVQAESLVLCGSHLWAQEIVETLPASLQVHRVSSMAQLRLWCLKNLKSAASAKFIIQDESKFAPTIVPQFICDLGLSRQSFVYSERTYLEQLVFGCESLGVRVVTKESLY